MRQKSLIPLLLLWLLLLVPATHAQDSADILARVNALRSSLGLSPYSLNGALNAAAQSHAQWMANSGQVSHTQSDGSTPRSRANAAGYGSQWVSENIYGGTNATVDVAWNFWVNSSVHYRGLTSPNYQEIGIGVAHADWGNTFVLVFGGSGGGYTVNAAAAGDSAGGGAPAAPPSFVVGVDAYGNIMHEIQPGDTLGDIALLYGYTWDDLAYMRALNEIDDTEVRELKVGAVFLVPPHAGTYTPTPGAAPTSTPEPETDEDDDDGSEVDGEGEGEDEVSDTPTMAAIMATVPTATPPPTFTPARIATAGAPAELLALLASPVAGMPTLSATTTTMATATVENAIVTATPQEIAAAEVSGSSDASLTSTRPRVMMQNKRSPWFLVAVGLQIVLLATASVELLRRLFKK